MMTINTIKKSPIALLALITMLSQAQAADKPSEDEQLKALVESAFKAAKTEQLPLSPENINEFQKRLDETGKAIFPSPAPKMVSRTQNVSLSPGSDPISIRLAPGYVSSIVIVDSTGEPWPITTDTVGNANWFSVVKPETAASNLLTINALKNHVSSNIAITLKDRDAPLIVQLVMDSDNDKPSEADMMVSLRVNQPGPNASAPNISAKVASTISSELMQFLDGVPPGGAKLLKLKDQPEGVQAWSMGNAMYLRTEYAARWPAWMQEANSSTGMHVYVMPISSKIILSINGQSRAIAVIN